MLFILSCNNRVRELLLSVDLLLLLLMLPQAPEDYSQMH